MPTAPLQVSHLLGGLQPPLSQTCQRYHNQQPTDADQPNHWLPALRLIQVTITFLLAVRPCVTCGKHCVTCVNCVNCVTCVTCQLDVTFCIPCVRRVTYYHLVSHFANCKCHQVSCGAWFAFQLVTLVSHLCHTCVTFVSHLCNICVTLVSHWLATLSHSGLPCFTSGWSGLSLVVATSLGCLWPFWSFRSNVDPFGLTLIHFDQILMTSPPLKWSVLPGEILTSTETNLQRWNLNLSLNLYSSLNSHLHLSLNWNLRGKDVYVEALAFLNDIFTISCFPSFVI